MTVQEATIKNAQALIDSHIDEVMGMLEYWGMVNYMAAEAPSEVAYYEGVLADLMASRKKLC